MMKHTFFIFAFLIFLISSCEQKKNQESNEITSIDIVNIDTPNTVIESQKTKISRTVDSSLIMSAFRDFKKALLVHGAVDIIRISQMPIKGDCGFYRINKKINPESDDALGLITKDMLFQNSQLLDSIEYEVLKSYQIFQNNNELEYDHRVFEGNFWMREDASTFCWSVGCVRSIDLEDPYEYSIIFTFEKINNHYKLTTINCAG
tara:strand:+ start:211 stop:825 length:615 start_codon:yes stop_codon:yes gene_type:complete